MDGVEEEIQLAERYLLSAIYNSAASTASQVLNKLMLKSPETKHLLYSPDGHELRSFVESAGMILVQATGEMGRLGSVFTALEDQFGSLEFVPHYLFLPAICLQVTSQLYYPAELALQRYLDGWSALDAEYYSKSVEGWTILLPNDVYEDLSEIFALHVLARKDSKKAISLVQSVDIPESRRQEILSKIFSKQRTITVTENKPQNSHVRADEPEAPADRKVAKLSPSWLKLSHDMLRVLWLQIQSRGTSQSAVIVKMVGGTFTFLVLYALLKRRLLIIRLLMNGLKRARRSLVDFYELAFGLQINPLATAQAVPNARY